MVRVFLNGYRRLDFPAKDDPNRQIKGYSIFICTPKDDVFGVVPVDDGGKRFISDAAALNMGMSKKFLDENLYDFINIEIDVNGKIVDCAALTDEERSAPDYPFSDAKEAAPEAPSDLMPGFSNETVSETVSDETVSETVSDETVSETVSDETVSESSGGKKDRKGA